MVYISPHEFCFLSVYLEIDATDIRASSLVFTWHIHMPHKDFDYNLGQNSLGHPRSPFQCWLQDFMFTAYIHSFCATLGRGAGFPVILGTEIQEYYDKVSVLACHTDIGLDWLPEGSLSQPLQLNGRVIFFFFFFLGGGSVKLFKLIFLWRAVKTL